MSLASVTFCDVHVLVAHLFIFIFQCRGRMAVMNNKCVSRTLPIIRGWVVKSLYNTLAPFFKGWQHLLSVCLYVDYTKLLKLDKTTPLHSMAM